MWDIPSQEKSPRHRKIHIPENPLYLAKNKISHSRSRGIGMAHPGWGSLKILSILILQDLAKQLKDQLVTTC